MPKTQIKRFPNGTFRREVDGVILWVPDDMTNQHRVEIEAEVNATPPTCEIIDVDEFGDPINIES